MPFCRIAVRHNQASKSYLGEPNCDAGTFLPFLRAIDIAIAIACFRRALYRAMNQANTLEAFRNSCPKIEL